MRLETMKRHSFKFIQSDALEWNEWSHKDAEKKTSKRRNTTQRKIAPNLIRVP